MPVRTLLVTGQSSQYHDWATSSEAIARPDFLPFFARAGVVTDRHFLDRVAVNDVVLRETEKKQQHQKVVRVRVA